MGEESSLETHVVKKYANRKLYDTHSRRYITLDVIADLLRRGCDVRVVDRTSGEDITAVTLSQILLDMERHRRSPIPEPLLVDLVKERGEQLIQMLRSSLTLPREIRQRATGSLERGAERIENRVDDVLSTGLRQLSIASVEDVTAVERRLDDLARQVRRLSAAVEALQPAAPRGTSRRRARGASGR